jgi:hypothetical protein
MASRVPDAVVWQASVARADAAAAAAVVAAAALEVEWHRAVRRG